VAINGISPWITLTGLFVDDLEIGSPVSGVPSDVPVIISGPTAHPNPFNPRTAITFNLGISSSVELNVHDLRGHHVKTLLAEFLQEGHHEVCWDGTDDQGRILGSGTYLLNLISADGNKLTKLVLVR